MKLTDKIRRDWHYYAIALGLIFILNGVVGLLGFETQGWQSYAVGLVTWSLASGWRGLLFAVVRRSKPRH
nr:inner membrane protein [Raoultella sp. NCTC 9187]